MRGGRVDTGKTYNPEKYNMVSVWFVMEKESAGTILNERLF
jgi:hypothetical protein